MENYPYPMLQRPNFAWIRDTEQQTDIKVHEWIETATSTAIDFSAYDVTILGAPLSKSSISTSAASENPDAMRKAWKYFSTYNIDEDVDLSKLKAIDLGNVRQHVTDILYSQRKTREAMAAMRTHHPQTLPITMGGDHSITAELVKGWKAAHPDETIGILQLDSHFDLRSLDGLGPANGTPIRNLLDSGTVEGKHIHNIGLHGFFNAKELREYADEAGVHYVTLKQARKKGMAETIREALDSLDEQADTIYLTVDMDVLDIIHGPATPAAAPGGMYSAELFDAVQIAGEHPKVKAMDIVCVDPRNDIAQITVKNAVYAMLIFLVGFCKRGE